LGHVSLVPVYDEHTIPALAIHPPVVLATQPVLNPSHISSVVLASVLSSHTLVLHFAAVAVP